ncbi:MAG: isoprenyl transferase [Gammaproteobacteria bacterium]
MSDPDLRMPRHVAIIMDGNGRWAEKRQLPRIAGHRAGVESVRRIVKACGENGIRFLTLFAFSSENWRRPKREVSLLMDLFLSALQQEIEELDDNNVRLRVLGDRQAFPEGLQDSIRAAEKLTACNEGLHLFIAANYGGRWDITQAVKGLAQEAASGSLDPAEINSELIGFRLSLHGVPDPDLFIRTGGEQRISNFLLWHLAYTELYFTACLWPEFDRDEFAKALASFATRQRRFGQTAEQVQQLSRA